VVGSAGKGSGGTGYSRSGASPSTARLVARIVTPRQRPSKKPLQAKAAAQAPCHQVAGGLGEQHLPAMRGRLHPGAAVDRCVVDVIASAYPHLPGVQPHPHPQRDPRGPCLTTQLKLASASRLDRGNRAGKDGEEAIPLPTGDNHHPTMAFDDFGQKAIMLL
jgi:hypothetical protein